MAPKRKQVDLGELGDKAIDALTTLEMAGYQTEVKAIRDFIQAEGNFFRESMRVNHEVQNDLMAQLKARPVDRYSK